MSELKYIPLDEIHSTGNIRIGEELDPDFAESIAQHGVLQAVLVTPNDNGYNLIDGHQRLAAARLAGQTTIPAQVREEGDDRVVLQLVQNIQRKDLDPIEEALAFDALQTQGVQQADIAKLVGVGQSHISKRKSLLKLSDALQNRVRLGKLDVNLAVELAKVRDHAAQEKLAERENLSEHGVAMALRRQKEEDNLAKFIKQATSKGARVDDDTDLTGYRRLEDFSTYEDLAKADLPEDAVVRATTDWDGKPCLRAYVPTYGNTVVDGEEGDKKAESKKLREATRERQTHLKMIVAKAAAKDVAPLAASLFFDRLVSHNNARKISELLDLDPTVGGYITEEKLAPDAGTGEIKTRKSVDYVRLVNDWYTQGTKNETQALMAAIIVNYDRLAVLETFLSDKGVPTIDELLATQE